MFKIKLTNKFQDSYNQQHLDGFLSESDVYGADFDPHRIATFGTREAAEEVISGLQFIDNPDLSIKAE